MAYNSVKLYPATGYSYTLSVNFSETITEAQKVNNKSTIIASGKLQSDGSYWSTSYASELILYWHDNKDNTDKQVGYLQFKGLSYAGDSRTVSGTFEVEHKSDGTLSGYLIARFNKGSTTSAYAPNSGSVNTDWTALTTIPRATKLSNQVMTIDREGTISWTKASSGFTHKLTYEFGSLTGTIGENLVDSVNWTPPTTFYEVIKEASSGTGKLYLTTYNGTTKIGDTQSATLTIYPNEEESKAVIGDTSVKDENQETKNLTGYDDVLIIGKSILFAEITFTTRKYATAKSLKINGVSYNFNENPNQEKGENTEYYFQDTIGIATTGTFNIEVIDSRGFVTKKAVINEVVNYIPLDIIPTFRRIQPTTGEVGLSFDGKYFNQSFGEVDNTLEIKYAYKKSNEENYSASITLTENKDYKISGNTFYSGNGDKKTEISLGTIFDYRYVYNFILYVKDKLTTLAVNVLVVKGIPIIWWNGEKVTVNGDLFIADRDGNNEINVKDSLGGSGDTLPIGAIVDYDGTTVPNGYEEVNETAVNLKTSIIHQVTPTVGSNYELYGNTYYYKVGSRVHVHVGISINAQTYTTIFTLPVGFRPKTMLGFAAIGSGLDNFAGLQIKSDGAVTIIAKNGYALADMEFDTFEE